MSRRTRKKSEKTRRRPLPNDCLVLLGQELGDRAAAELSAVIDAPADRAWLAAHPMATTCTRQASPLEVCAFNLPAGTLAIITRGPGGSQIRAFRDPV